jgi:3',5'-cyclic AMP phosphodiesterase CpdA
MSSGSRMMRLALALALSLTVLPAWGASRQSTAELLSEAGPTFTIAAPQGGWSVIAYGDMRFTYPGNTIVTNPQARRALVAKVAAEKPDVLLLSGDVPYNGGVANDYAVYREETAAWRAEGLKVFPALGNHELHGSNAVENWWNAFPELKGRRWYSVEFGEAYFITLDSNLDLMPGGTQSAWLTKQLDGLPKGTKYVFISLHHPPVADPIAFDSSHDVRSNERALAQQLEAAAKHISAKIIVVAGHIHAYERFERGGVVYLVSGGGGAAQHHIARSREDLFQDNTFPNFHYVKFTSEHGAMKATMYQLDAQGGFKARDRFVVTAAKGAAR